MHDRNMTSSDVSSDRLLDHLRTVIKIRAAEERTQALRLEGEIVGSVHLAIGQEAIPVGACATLEPQDAVFATYRGHGWALAAGAPLEPFFAELLGRETGFNAGRGGSAYFSAPAYRFYGENSIVGAGAPIATGAALAALYDASARVVLCAFGDGAMNQGAVHEAMNFASVMGAPVVFVCENNVYSELTPISDMIRVERLSDRAAAYGFPGRRVDGNDPVAVESVVGEAVARARDGAGPTLVEAMTERLVGHYIGDAEHYRPTGEVEQAREREPIVRLRRELKDRGIDCADLDQLEAAVRSTVDSAATAALADPAADSKRVMEHLYA